MRGISGQAYAILIASSRYPDEPQLQDLRCPENDVDGLNDILTSKVYGLFTQTFVLKNRPHYAVMQKIVEVLRKAAKEDFVLIYYSGHGKLNRVGNLHLATVNTMLDTLEATSIPVQSIRDFIDISSSTKIALILDCCFSGAAGEILSKGSVEDQLQKASQGRGKYIITASTGVQVAQEKESDQYGMLTKHIIEGIKGGKADYDEDGLISVDELYRYVHDHVLEEASQEPTKWDLNVRGELYIARTGKTPKQERRRQIRRMVLDLGKKGMLADEILVEALKVLAMKPTQASEKFQTYSDLLNRFFEKQFGLGEFVELWYRAKYEPTKAEKKEVPAFVERVAKEKKSKISGSVRHTAEATPVVGAKINLSIEDKELAVLFSDSQGRFEHQEAAYYVGQILTCQVEKEKYQSKTMTHRIEQDEVSLEIELARLPLEKIEFSLTVKDEKVNPLEDVAVTLEVDANQVGAGVSDKNGVFKISLNPELESRTLRYKANLRGYQSVKGKARVDKRTSCQISMTRRSGFDRIWLWVGCLIAIEATVLGLGLGDHEICWTVNNLVLIPMATVALAFFRPINWKYAVLEVGLLHAISGLVPLLRYPEYFMLEDFIWLALLLLGNAVISGLISKRESRSSVVWLWIGGLLIVVTTSMTIEFSDRQMSYFVNNVALIPLATFALAFITPILWKYAIVHVVVLQIFASAACFLRGGYPWLNNDAFIVVLSFAIIVNVVFCSLISFLRLKRLGKESIETTGRAETGFDEIWLWIGGCLSVTAIFISGCFRLESQTALLVNNVAMIPLGTLVLSFFRPINWKCAVAYVAVFQVITLFDWFSKAAQLAAYEYGMTFYELLRYYARLSSLVLFSLALVCNALFCGLISFLRLRRLRRSLEQSVK